MNSKVLVGVMAVAIGMTAQVAQANHGRYGDYYGRHDNSWRDDGSWRNDNRGSDYARVVYVEPLREQVRYSVPVEQCWTEQRYRNEYRPDRTGAAIVGGAMGAILGSTIGHGDGRRAATLGGAVMGAAVGSELARNDARGGYREPRYEEVQRCNTRQEVRYDDRVVGYRVTYDYNGRRQVTQLPYDPGRYLRVSVDVHPLP